MGRKWLSDALDEIGIAAGAAIGALSSVAASLAALYGHRVVALECLSLAGICILLWRTASKIQAIDSKIHEIEDLRKILRTQTEASNIHVGLLYNLLPPTPPNSCSMCGSADTRVALSLLQSSTFGKIKVDELFWSEWGKFMLRELYRLDNAFLHQKANEDHVLALEGRRHEILRHIRVARKDLSLWIDKDWRYHLIRILIGRAHFLALDDEIIYRAVAVEEDIDALSENDLEARKLLVELPLPVRRIKRIFYIKNREKMKYFIIQNANAIAEQLNSSVGLRYCDRPIAVTGHHPISEIGIYADMAFGRYARDGSNTISFDTNKVREWKVSYDGWWERSEPIIFDKGRILLGQEVVYEQ